MKRELFKDIELQGKKWRINKFDALTGYFIAYKLLFQILPGGMESQMPGVNLPEGRSLMSKAEFIELQRDCLAVCTQLIMVGDVETAIPVLQRGGQWGVDGLETDVVLVFTLTLHCLLFNISGFFEEGALKELTQSFQTLSLFNAST